MLLVQKHASQILDITKTLLGLSEDEANKVSIRPASRPPRPLQGSFAQLDYDFKVGKLEYTASIVVEDSTPETAETALSVTLFQDQEVVLFYSTDEKSEIILSEEFCKLIRQALRS